MRFAWLEYLNAFRNVTRQYRRSLFGISAVTFGVVALTLAAGFIEWIFWATREGTIQAGLGHIHVMRPGYLDGGQADPLKYLLPQESPIKDAIGRFPTVRLIAPRLAFTGLISHGDATISFIGEAVNPEQERELSPRLIIPAGHALASDDPKGIVLGWGLAEILGVKVGEKVVLLGTTPTGGINAVECTVRGLFNTVSKAYDDSALRVPLPIAQQLLRVSGSHRWILLLEDTKYATPTVLALREKFRGSGVEFVPWYDLADFYNKVVALLSTQIGVVQLIIAVIIVLSISNTMMMNVLERTAEIGTCLAIGRTRRQILRQFVYEGMTIGLIGGSLGLFLGWLLATLISWVGIPMPPPPGMSQGYNGEILFTRQLALFGFVLAVGTSLLASFYPAWKASRMGIVDALRHNR
uniref:LolE permease component of an ABC-transporter system n=1 Tax=uncultured bacterium CSL132 TaxID=1091568 RepID=G4WVJ9_9BACT|nr:LolE permease component of an ABC-transporter system [uncultured bacterium CSL132]